MELIFSFFRKNKVSKETATEPNRQATLFTIPFESIAKEKKKYTNKVLGTFFGAMAVE